LVILCETNVLNLISQRLDTICQIKPKHATIFFLHLFTPFYTTKHSLQLSWSNSCVSSLFIYNYIFTLYIFFCTICICRHEMLTHKQKRLTDVGFIYLNRVFKVPMHVMPYNKWRPQTELNLFRFLERHADKTQILFPYNYKWVWMSWTHFILLIDFS
jgi:hypothetical protein